MLVNLLNSHPEIRCFFEVFHRYQASIPFHIPGYNRRSKHSGLVKMHVENPAVFAKKYIYGKHLSHIRAVGFKLLYTQARNTDEWWDRPEFARWWEEVPPPPKWGVGMPSLWDYLAEEKVAVIHLTRNNILEKRVSAQVALKTGKWGISASGGMDRETFSGTIEIDPEDLWLDFKGDALFKGEINRRFKNSPMLEVTYDSLIGEPGKLAEIQRFLSVKPQLLQTPTKKQGKYNLKEVISNFYALKKEFQHSPFSHYFEAERWKIKPTTGPFEKLKQRHTCFSPIFILG